MGGAASRLSAPCATSRCAARLCATHPASKQKVDKSLVDTDLCSIGGVCDQGRLVQLNANGAPGSRAAHVKPASRCALA